MNIRFTVYYCHFFTHAYILCICIKYINNSLGFVILVFKLISALKYKHICTDWILIFFIFFLFQENIVPLFTTLIAGLRVKFWLFIYLNERILGSVKERVNCCILQCAKKRTLTKYSNRFWPRSLRGFKNCPKYISDRFFDDNFFSEVFF